MIHTCSRCALMVYYGDAYLTKRLEKSLIGAMHHRTEGTTEHSGPMQRFGKVDSFGQPCMEMPRSSYGDVPDVRNTGISIPVTQCPCRAIFRWKSSTYGELTTWVRSLCQIIASTFWWQWIMSPSGLKHYHVLQPTQSTQRKCSKRPSSLVLECLES